MNESTSHVDDVFRLVRSQFIHILVVTQGACVDSWIEITSAPQLLGRSDEGALDLADPGISSRHCTIGLSGDEVMVNDLGSRNGTWIDGERVVETGVLPVGSRMQIGKTVLRHELRSPDELEHKKRQRDGLDRAASYVEAMLPQRLRTGKIRTDWSFIPSTNLGGDAFGYHYLTEDCFAIYFLDVCGHGPDAALHSISVLNVLRRGSLPFADFTQPAEVLTALNEAFPMDTYKGMYFTIWYGVYQPSRRTISWSSAGHPPALLIPGSGGRGRPLGLTSFPAGMIEDASYRAVDVLVPPGGRLVLYSDGAYEFVTKEGPRLTHPEFLDLIDAATEAEMKEARQVEQILRERLAAPTFEDDFSLLMLEFE